MKVTITYDEVTATAQRRGPCPVCGKRTTRSRTFTNTVNPFNKRPDGLPKIRHEVQDDVDRLAEAWSPPADVFTHNACRENG